MRLGVVPVWGPRRWKPICTCPMWKRLRRVPGQMREQGDLWIDLWIFYPPQHSTSRIQHYQPQSAADSLNIIHVKICV